MPWNAYYIDLKTDQEKILFGLDNLQKIIKA